MKTFVDTQDAEENKGGYVLIPEDVYDVQINEVGEKTTKNGDPMASVKFVILTGEYKGKWLFDNIVIPKPGSPSFGIMGRTMHFLHVIGQPYQGKFSVDTDSWPFKKLKVKVKHKVQEQGKRAGETVAVVDGHDFAEGHPVDDEVPF